LERRLSGCRLAAEELAAAARGEGVWAELAEWLSELGV